MKAIQAVVESQSNRLASLTAQKEVAALGHQDESTGQGLFSNFFFRVYDTITCFILLVVLTSACSSDSDSKLSEVIQGYITQIEELK